MAFTTEKNGSALTVSLGGELNATTAPELDTLLNEQLPGITDLTLDFADCDYVSSAGIRVLLATHKQMKAANGNVHFTNVGEFVMDIFENTLLDGVFDIR